MLTYQLHSDHWRYTILLQKVYRRSKWVIVAIVQPSTTSHTDIHRLSTFRDPKTAIFVCIPQSYRYICDDWAILLYMFLKSRNTSSSTVHFPSHSRKWPNCHLMLCALLSNGSWNMGNQNLCSMGILLHHIPRAQPAPLALKLHLLQEPAPFHEKVTIKETPLPNDDGNWKTHFKQSARNF